MSKQHKIMGAKKLKELLSTRELSDAIAFSEENQSQLLLRKKRRLDYNDKYSEAIKLKLSKGLKNGRWSYEEHKNFIVGIFKFGYKWKEITKLIATRNGAQSRSHCQKFFNKLCKFTDDPNLLRYINLKNLFEHGKIIEEEKMQILQEFLIKAYDQIENAENLDYYKNCLVVKFLKDMESKTIVPLEGKDAKKLSISTSSETVKKFKKLPKPKKNRTARNQFKKQSKFIKSTVYIF